MVEWIEQRVIDVGIEEVWSLFKDENTKRIMPKLKRHILIEKEQHEVDATIIQAFENQLKANTSLYKGSNEETFLIGKSMLKMSSRQSN